MRIVNANTLQAKEAILEKVLELGVNKPEDKN